MPHYLHCVCVCGDIMLQMCVMRLCGVRLFMEFDIDSVGNTQ